MKKRNFFWILPVSILAALFLLTAGCEKKSTTDNTTSPIDTITNDTGKLIIPAGWSKVGDLRANDMIWGLTKDPSGNVYAGGYFTNSSGYRYVARWNGTVWEDIGLKANNMIFNVASDISGNVYAIGMFTNGATPTGGNTYVAKWNGSQWSDIGALHSQQILVPDAVGNMYNGIARWNGGVWKEFSPLNPETTGTVNALATIASGNLQYAGGSYAHTNGYRYVAEWNGTNWTEVGTLNANADINALAVDNGGNIYAAGEFTNGNLPTNGYHYVAKWNGSNWSELGSLKANSSIFYLAVDNVHGWVYASGYITNAAGNYFVTKWDGTSWSDLGNMYIGPTPIYVDSSGKLYSVVCAVNGKNFCVVVHN
jgi:hypothetical protein